MTRDLAQRIQATVELLQKRGYAVSVAQLAQWLVGGKADVQQIHQTLAGIEGLCLSNGLVHARDLPEAVLERAQHRQKFHECHRRQYWPQVLAYVDQLNRHCPQIRCIALAGSMSSGGFVSSDDVDFNLFVQDGSRYWTYLLANILALGFAVAHRKRPTDAHTRRLVIPKLMSINVIWCDGDTQPFIRQDGPMALELLLSQPLTGQDYYQAMLGRNLWLKEYFPQLYTGLPRVEPQSPTVPLYPGQELLARGITYGGWRWIMWTRRNNPEALARVAYVRQCQSPYALFES